MTSGQWATLYFLWAWIGVAVLWELIAASLWGCEATITTTLQRLTYEHQHGWLPVLAAFAIWHVWGK